MDTIIVLIVVAFTSTAGGPPAIVVQEMPTMRVCESVGESIADFASGRVQWTCIEGAR